MTHLYDVSGDAILAAEPNEPSVINLESRRSRRARAEATVAALKAEFSTSSASESAAHDVRVVTHPIFSDERGPERRRQRQQSGELPEPQAVQPPDMPA